MTKSVDKTGGHLSQTEVTESYHRPCSVIQKKLSSQIWLSTAFCSSNF